MERSRRRQVQLYSESLTDFCNDNTLYLELLKDHVDELDKLKQHEAFIKEAKKENELHQLSKSADPRNRAVMFTQLNPADEKLFKLPAKTGEYEDFQTSHQRTENPFCYLCSTMEQHRKHMMKSEKRIHGKKRIPYEAPAPFVPPKPLPQKPPVKECLFKVTIKTGTHIEAACSEPVYISLFGKKSSLEDVRLTKKFGSLGFFFDGGSTEVFHLRGPRIGRLEEIMLKLGDGPIDEVDDADHESRKSLRRRRKWLVESVSIKDYATGLEYHFAVDRWLRVGKLDGRQRDRVEMTPTSSVKSQASTGRGIVVTIHTGGKATSGTDCRVYISLLGPTGAKARHELKQPPDAERIFQVGSKDAFELYVDDFGDLKGIRLELDTQNMRPLETTVRKKRIEPFDQDRDAASSKTWFVDQVIVKDMKSGQKWLFTTSDWLNEDNPMKEFWTVKEMNDQSGILYTQTTQYVIDVTTGKKNFAGTDSTIYLALFDKANRRCDIELRDEDKSKFEAGKTDTITETARVIDTPERLKVSISGAGVAPDWHMDGIRVTKYLVMEEILQHLQRLQFSNKMPKGLAQESGNILFEAAAAQERKHRTQKKRQDMADEVGDKAERRERKKKKKKHEKRKRDAEDGKKQISSSSRDFHAFGHRRSSLGGSSIRSGRDGRKDDSRSNNSSSSSSSSSRGSSVSSDSSDSVKSHDDFDPNHGSVRLPYAVQVSFAPRSKDDAWLKKNKTVELRAADPGKLLYKQLRLRSDNETFEKLRKEMQEKQQADDAARKKRQQKRQKRAASAEKEARSGGRSAKAAGGRARARSSSSDSSSSSDAKPAGRTAAKRGSVPSGSGRSAGQKASLKKSPKHVGRYNSTSSLSDSDSSVDAFGKTKKRSVDGKKSTKDDKKLAPSVGKKNMGSAGSVTRKTEDDDKKFRRASVAKEPPGAPRSSTRSPRLTSDRDRPTGLDHVDFDAERRLQELDKGRGVGPERAQDRDRLDLDKGRSRLDSGKGKERSPWDLDRGRERLDADRDLDRGHTLDLDRDSGGRLNLGRNQDRGRLEPDRSGRLDFDRGGGRSPRDLGSGRGRLDQDRSRLDMGGRLDLGRDQDRGRFEPDRSGRLDFDRGGGRHGLAQDNPRILVTATDGHSAEGRAAPGRLRQRSFNLD